MYVSVFINVKGNVHLVVVLDFHPNVLSMFQQKVESAIGFHPFALEGCRLLDMESSLAIGGGRGVVVVSVGSDNGTG